MRDEGAYAVKIRSLDQIMRFGRKAICKIVTHTGIQGTGALYKVKRPERHLHLFITCNHVLASSSFEEVCAAELDFQDLQGMRFISLPRKHLLHVWTVKHLDATVVEFNDELANFFKLNKAHFLKIGIAQAKEQVE